MSVPELLHYSGPGAYGQYAAAKYKTVLPENRHAVPIQYTPDFQKAGASDDLFAYAKSFDENHDDTYNAEEIEKASGLDLDKFSPKGEIEKLWDTNQDGQVDDKEMFTGLAHLDSADGAVDGKITEAGRTHVEKTNFGYPEAERLKQTSTYQTQNRFISGQPSNPEAVADALSQLSPEDQQDPNAILDKLSQFSPKPQLANHFRQQRDGLVQQQIQTAHDNYQNTLQQVAAEVDVDAKYTAYKGKGRSTPLNVSV